MTNKIKVFAPATVANVACGFDIFGFAVDNPGDELILTKSNTKGFKILSIEGDEGRLPLGARLAASNARPVAGLSVDPDGPCTDSVTSRPDRPKIARQ